MTTFARIGDAAVAAATGRDWKSWIAAVAARTAHWKNALARLASGLPR